MIRQVLDKRPAQRFLALSVSDAPEDVIAIIRAGARGYVTKTISGPELADAVRRVAGGGSALDPEVVALLLGRRRREDPLEGLTAREREVLGLMAEGRSNAAIAEALVVTERAVEKHVTSIFVKLDLTPASEDHRRVLAVLRYLQSA